MIKPNIRLIYRGTEYKVANINFGGGYSWDNKDAETITLAGESAVFTINMKDLDEDLDSLYWGDQLLFGQINNTKQ